MNPPIDTHRGRRRNRRAAARGNSTTSVEAKHAALYRAMLALTPEVRVPRGVARAVDAASPHSRLARRRQAAGAQGVTRSRRANRIAVAMFKAWVAAVSRFGVIHGDPHLGNYTAFMEDGTPQGINLLDYGCIRIFAPKFVGGVVDLYHGLLRAIRLWWCMAYETWGSAACHASSSTSSIFGRGSSMGRLLDDRERTHRGRSQAVRIRPARGFRVHRALKERGPVRVPREFVFMDRAAIGLGGVFLHLAARLNFHHLFSEAIEKFGNRPRGGAQRAALEAAGLGTDEG